MDGFQRRLSAFIRTVKSVQYEDVQNLVREATSNDPVSAPDELIWKVIHAASMGSNNYALISEILWKRIGDIAHPLHVYKALTLLYHLLQHGDNKNIFREDSKNRIHEIRELKQYTYFKNEGSLVNDIRRAAATIEDMLLNPNKVVEKPSSSEVKSASDREASPRKSNVAKASPRTDAEDQKRASVAAAPRRPSTNEAKPKKAKEEEEPAPAPAKPASKPRKKSSVDQTAEADIHASRSGNMLAPPGGPSEAHRHKAPNPNAPPMPIDIINSGAMPVTPVDDILALAFNSPPQQPPRQFAGNPFEAIPVTDPSVQGQPFEEFDQNPWAEPAQSQAKPQRK